MSRSVVYFLFVSFVTSVAAGLAVLVVSANLCSSDRYCVFAPQVGNAQQTTPMVTPTVRPVSTVTPRPTNVPPNTIIGLAILGDSTQDEYQADNPRGGEYAATTFNWVELLVRYRELSLGSWGTRPEPRRGGYAYNWARSAATSANMIATGQHTGAATQIKSGAVSHAAIQIGINDFYFSGLGQQIYDGQISGDALTAQLDTIVANITAATRALRDARPRGLLLVATQDYLTLPIVPEVQAQYSDPVRRQRVTKAFAYMNDRLREFAAREGIPFFDYNAAMLTEINARRDSQGFLVVSRERIDLSRRGNAPFFGLLDDQYVHPGTVLSGLSANVYIRAFNSAFGTSISPFTDQEILRAAGITP
jgi:lysophospholipase L1-like esterase